MAKTSSISGFYKVTSLTDKDHKVMSIFFHNLLSCQQKTIFSIKKAMNFLLL